MIVNLHAQLNMLGGLMLLLTGLSLVALHALGRRVAGAPRAADACGWWASG